MPSHSVVSNCAAPWTVALQAPLSMGFSRQEHWSGLLFPPPGGLPNPGTEPESPALQADSLPSEPPGKPNPWLVVRAKRALGVGGNIFLPQSGSCHFLLYLGDNMKSAQPFFLLAVLGLRCDTCRLLYFRCTGLVSPWHVANLNPLHCKVNSLPSVFLEFIQKTFPSYVLHILHPHKEEYKSAG